MGRKIAVNQVILESFKEWNIEIIQSENKFVIGD